MAQKLIISGAGASAPLLRAGGPQAKAAERLTHFDSGHGHGAHAFLPAGEAQAFIGSGLYAHLGWLEA